MLHALWLTVLIHCEMSHSLLLKTLPSLSGSSSDQIQFFFHSQNVPSDIYTLGIQGRSLQLSSMKFLTWNIDTFPVWATPAPILCRVCLEYHSGNIFSFSSCLEEEVADGSRIVIAVVVVLVQITKKPLSESVIVVNWNTAVDAEGKSW